MEQALRRRHGHQGRDFPRAAGFAEDGYIARVAAEARNVGPHPLQRRHAVEHAGVARKGLAAHRGQVQEAEDVQAVVDGHHHNALMRRQRGPVVPGRRAAPHDVAAAVEPDHHRQPGLERWGPYVQGQTVLALRVERLRTPFLDDDREGRLWADPPEAGGLQHAGPRLARSRRLEAVGAPGRGGIGDSLEDRDRPLGASADRAAGGADHWFGAGFFVEGSASADPMRDAAWRNACECGLGLARQEPAHGHAGQHPASIDPHARPSVTGRRQGDSLVVVRASANCS